MATAETAIGARHSRHRMAATTTPTVRQSHEGAGFLAAARDLAPVVRAAAIQAEAERRLPASLVAALRDAGLFRMAVPRSLGGPEVDPITVGRVVEELATADASAAWCVMLANQANSGAGFLPPDGAAEVFGGSDAIPAAVLRPVGRAEIVDGGFRATGRWPFASGSTHATWLGGECAITRDGAPVKDDEGREVVRLLFFPLADVTIHDTWHTSGLRGTGSHDFSVEGAFVPERRSFRIHVDPPVHPSPLFRTPPLTYITHGSHALGIGQAAIDATIEMADAKPALRDQKRLQGQLAEAQALVESARAYLYGAAEELWRTVSAGGEGSPAQRARVRLATSHALKSSLQAVELLYRAAGTTAIFTTGPLDRLFRDIQTAAAHVMVSPLTYEASGRVALGMEPGMLLF
jgi:alkylation response protein AidB-like acyl-CoA dehydrogenase